MADIAVFAKFCRDGCEQVSRLVALLEREQQALVAGETASLEPLADEKRRMLEVLAQTSQQLQDWFGSNGIVDRPSVIVWLKDKPEACDAWFRLEGELKRALSLNEFNGQQINLGLSRTQEALGVLRTAAASAMAYRPDGSQGAVLVGGRHLGSA